MDLKGSYLSWFLLKSQLITSVIVHFLTKKSLSPWMIISFSSYFPLEVGQRRKKNWMDVVTSLHETHKCPQNPIFPIAPTITQVLSSKHKLFDNFLQEPQKLSTNHPSCIRVFSFHPSTSTKKTLNTSSTSHCTKKLKKKKQGMELHISKHKLFIFKLNISFQQNLFTYQLKFYLLAKLFYFLAKLLPFDKTFLLIH